MKVHFQKMANVKLLVILGLALDTIANGDEKEVLGMFINLNLVHCIRNSYHFPKSCGQFQKR